MFQPVLLLLQPDNVLYISLSNTVSQRHLNAIGLGFVVMNNLLVLFNSHGVVLVYKQPFNKGANYLMFFLTCLFK